MSGQRRNKSTRRDSFVVLCRSTVFLAVFSQASSYQWKRKLAAPLNQISFLRVQTSEPIKDSIEIKLPSGISILVPVSAVDSICAIVRQLAYLHSEPIGMRKSLDRLFGGIKNDLCRNMRRVACLCP